MTRLSLVARSVLNAVTRKMECPEGLVEYEKDLVAAALLAASSQVLKNSPEWLGSEGAVWFEQQLRFIAIELEQTHD
jgi:hypothetical protein